MLMTDEMKVFHLDNWMAVQWVVTMAVLWVGMMAALLAD